MPSLSEMAQQVQGRGQSPASPVMTTRVDPPVTTTKPVAGVDQYTHEAVLAQLRQAEATIDRAKEREERDEAEIERLTLQLRQARSEAQTPPDILRLQEDLERERRERLEAEQSGREARNEARLADQGLRESEGARTLAEANLRAATEENERKQRMIEGLEGAKREAERERDAYKREAGTAQANFESEQQAHQTTAERLRMAEANLQCMRQELQEARRTSDELDSGLRQTQQLLEETQQKGTGFAIERNQARERAEAAEAEVARLQVQVEQLQEAERRRAETLAATIIEIVPIVEKLCGDTPIALDRPLHEVALAIARLTEAERHSPERLLEVGVSSRSATRCVKLF